MDCSTPGSSVLSNLPELFKFMSIESMMLSKHLILCHPLFLLPSISPSMKVFSSESAICISWPKHCGFYFSISSSNEYSGLISFRIDWVDVLTVQGSLKSHQHQSKSINSGTQVVLRGTVWRFLKKLEIELPYDPAIPLLGTHTVETRRERDTCTPMFIAALFIIARTWKQRSCPSADEWIRKLWCIYTMEYYSAIKKKTFESVLMRLMKLEPIIQSEVSQKEKYQYSILMHIYGIQKDGNNNPVYETAKGTLMYRTVLWTLWERERVGRFGRMTLKHV